MTVENIPFNANFTLFAQIINRDLVITEDCVDDFLVLIGCHPELRALVTIAQHLTDILPIALQVTYDRKLKEQIPQWQQICNYVIAHSDTLVSSFPEIKQLSKNTRRAPFSKQFEEYPLYIALWYAYPDPDANHQLRYRLLQAILLLTQHVFRHLEDDLEKNYDSITHASTRLIRQFAELNSPEKVNELQPLFKRLPYSAANLDVYLNEISTLENDTDYYREPFINPIDVLKRMLKYAVRQSGGSTRSQSRVWSAILNREVLRENILESDPDDEKTSGFSIEAIQMYSQTEIQEQKSREAGCAFGEVKAGVEHFIFKDEKSMGNPMAGRSPIAHIKRSREKYKAIATSNQLISYRWDVLTVYELSLLLREVSNLARGLKFKNLVNANISNLELAALITTLYWTGTTIEAAIMARFVSDRMNLPQLLNADDFRFIKNSREWVHGSLRPAYKTSLDQETKDLVYDTNNLVVLPIQNKTDEIVRLWIAEVEGKRKKTRSKRIFNLRDTIDEAKPLYEAAIKTFLQQLNRQCKTRLTITRLSNDLMGRLFQQSGDITEAMIITGRNHYLGTVQLHYAAPSLDRLQTVYNDTCKKITESVYQSLKKNMPVPRTYQGQLTQAEAIQLHTGGRYYLRRGAVGELVQNLIMRFSDTLKFSGYSDYWVELHNDFTLYVAQLLGFATGYRAVRNPLACIDQIDWQTGFCCISDKDDMDYYNARLVWLPVLVRQQLRQYQTHCQRLGERIMLIHPSLAKKLLIHGETLDYSIPFLFLMKPNGRLLKLTPDETKKRLTDLFRVPCNVNRSYLRNRLRELGCSGEITKYFMGHWENGEEPFGIYATLSPMAYRDEISLRLDALLAEDGWRCIEGFGRLA